MQHIDNHMDELFRRAAESYPLATRESDWNDIAPLILNKAVSTKKGNNKRYRILGFLCLPVFILAGISTQLTIHRNVKPVTVAPAIAYNTTASPVVDWKDDGPAIKGKGSLTAIQYSETGKTGMNQFTPAISNEQDIYQQNDPGIRPAATGLFAFNIQPDDESVLPPPIKLKPGIVSENSESALAQPGIKSITKQNRGFYIGIAAGPQLNEIKRQGMRKTGIETGVIGGYRFNNHISAETGIFFSRKYYFSEGKYFDMKKAGSSMPPGMTILNIEGSSNIIEIPAKLKYDMARFGKAGLFSAAGISSYIMMKEKNNYLAMVNGNRETLTGFYNKTGRYLAAAVNLSIGYEHQLGRQSNIRVEPYIQIPIKGIGVGSMPVTSAGLHIGILWNHK